MPRPSLRARRPRFVALVLFASLVAAATCPGRAIADWPSNPLVNVPVCTAANLQSSPEIASDGAGGAFIAWSDQRAIANVSDIYAHHVLANGALDPAWAANGLAVCTATGSQFNCRVVADGSGGAFVAWYDYRGGPTSDIYATHVRADGVVDPAWPTDGRALCTATGDQTAATVVASGSGDAIVAWMDKRDGIYTKIYAQRATGPDGVAWAVDGVRVSTGIGDQRYPRITADGSGGAIVTWMDGRVGFNRDDIYAQRVQANGQLGGTVVGVSAAADLDFALDPIHPNPSRGGALSIRFSLAHEASVTVELMDLAGRRLAARALGTLGPGRHTSDLAPADRVPAGLYFVRLQAGGQSRSVRAAILE